jgi:prepilin-type N-terminal cleavage/methylation domain-containing protein
MLIRHPRREAGVTLIEMMVGIVVGLIVLWGLSTVYINTSRGSRTTSTANALNQDMRAVMDIMIRDLRRAGYWDTNVEGINPFTQPTKNIAINGAADCVLYSYDARHRSMPAGYTNVAGVPDPGTDFFGFRRSVASGVGAIQTLAPESTRATTAVATCGNAASGAGWENLTDDRAINVTGLTITTAGTQCMAYVKTSYNPSNVATFWPNNGVCNPATSAAPANAAFVETRQITITLTASSLTDTTLAARTLTDSVLVRNNRTVPAP